MSDSDIVQDFLVESYENLDRLDRDLVGLEKNPQDKEALAGVFRTIHTIKGTCGFLGFNKLEKVAHVGENLLTRLRDGQLTLNPDWYGNCNGSGCNGGSPQTFLNETVITEATDLSSRSAGYLYLMIMIDKGLIESGMTATSYSGASPGCPASTATTACVITVLEAAYDYVDHNWGRQSYYSKDPVSGDPMTLTFITESAFPNVTWTGTGGVWPTLKSYMSKYATPYKIVQEWTGSFGEVDGTYIWPQPLTYNNSYPGSQFCWAWPGYNDSTGECESYDYISSYYTLAQENSGIQMGSFYVGFDGSYNHNMLARQCGQLFDFLGQAITTAGYSSSKQLPWVLLATWNDYGEGTNVENGVDNCWRVESPTISSTTVK